MGKTICKMLLFWAKKVTDYDYCGQSLHLCHHHHEGQHVHECKGKSHKLLAIMVYIIIGCEYVRGTYTESDFQYIIYILYSI